jgi:hypothetical protein
MNISQSELPSNRNFGFFFTAIFLISAIYFFFGNEQIIALTFFLLTLVFFTVSILRDSLLLPLNKLWMRLGLLLGRIVSPIVLAVLFFLMFAPIGIFMRIFGRDELRLKKLNYDSFWKLRDQSDKASSSFTQQF